MMITERQLRQIIREELVNEGFMDKFKSMFGGGGGAASALGISEQDIEDAAQGRIRQLESRTRPAKFTFTVVGRGTTVVFTPPSAVAADVEASGMLDYFTSAYRPNQQVFLQAGSSLGGRVEAASPDPKDVSRALHEAIAAAHDQAINALGGKLFTRLFSL
jgi:hypothetical protein